MNLPPILRYSGESDHPRWNRCCSRENNLSIANMDFREFAESVDPDGVFRGFPQR